MSELQFTDYAFSAMTEIEGESCGAPLVFEDANDNSTKYLGGVWEKLSLAVQNHHKSTGDDKNCPAWTKWQPRLWSEQKMESRQKYIAWYNGIVAGFVNLQSGFPSQHTSDVQVMYLEHMASFPGFLPTCLWHRKVSGLGIPMLAYAIFQSFRQGHNGLVGLHAADGAIGFYNHLPEILGFQVFREIKYDVSGPPPHLDRAKSRPYLETIPEAANRILEAHHV